MEALENTTVTAVDQLATLYAQPSERVLRKEIDHVDAVGRAFIAAWHRAWAEHVAQHPRRGVSPSTSTM